MYKLSYLLLFINVVQDRVLLHVAGAFVTECLDRLVHNLVIRLLMMYIQFVADAVNIALIEFLKIVSKSVAANCTDVALSVMLAT